MKFYAIIFFKQILNTWYISREFMTIAKFFNQLRQWQQAGYFTEDVWTELDVLVNVETLSNQKSDPENLSSEVHMKSYLLLFIKNEDHKY